MLRSEVSLSPPGLVDGLVVVGRVEPVFFFQQGPVVVGGRDRLGFAHLVDAGRGIVEDSLLAEDGDGAPAAFLAGFDQGAALGDGEDNGRGGGDDIAVTVAATLGDMQAELRAHRIDLLL
jgi:hypothetical protein